MEGSSSKNILPKINLAKIVANLSHWTSRCNASVQTMKELVERGNLLNQRQCEDLTSKLTLVNTNIDKLLGQTKGFWVSHSPIKNFYWCLEKAKMLVTSCGERKWWHAAAFQWRNEHAFQEILLDASLCYNVIYYNARSSYGCTSLNLKVIEESDLRLSEVFEPASASDVQEDHDALIHRLTQLVWAPEEIEDVLCPCHEDLTLAQSLAKYIFLEIFEKSIEGMWEKREKHDEQPGTWGPSYHRVMGTNRVAVVTTTWFGIKCFKKEFHGSGKDYEKMFLNEAAIITHVKHPCIIRALCCGNGQEPTRRFIATELMDKSLSELIEERKGKPLSYEARIDIIVQIARGMCYLHDQGVAHRDLKPQNVVVSEMTSKHLQGYYSVKLIDFGTSKTEVEVAKSSPITFFGIGTTLYRAPELHPKAKVDSKLRAKWFNADVYSFAMTCVHVLCLHEPKFKDMKTLDSLYDEVMNRKRPDLPKDCPQILCDLVIDCWNTIPSRRPTFDVICSRLETYRFITLTNKTIDDYQGRGFPAIDNFINEKIEAQSSIYRKSTKVVLDRTSDEDENNSSDLVAIISCTSNHELQYLEYKEGAQITCDVCGQRIIDGELYQCSTCRFDAHRHCAEIREMIDVSIHGHSLQLLTRNYYNNNSEVVCSLCHESLQHSEWVYRCERCDYDVHAMCTKLLSSARWTLHDHPLILRPCPPRKSLVCGCCNGDIREHTWHYYCGPCGYSVHLEEVVPNLHSFKDASMKKEFLEATHEMLEKMKQLAKEETSDCPGPRIALFFRKVVKDGCWTRELLSYLQSTMMDVHFALLCEEQGHEHIVEGKTGKFNKELGKELAKKLEPLLSYGLHIATNNIPSGVRENELLIGSESITMPNLEANVLWDLRAVDISKGEEDTEVLKQAASSSAEWFQRWNEIRGFNITETYGLHRIRYIVGEEENHPHRKQGSVAWLCSKHFFAGLQQGILESFSSKYHNVEDDYEIRYPPYLRVVE